MKKNILALSALLCVSLYGSAQVTISGEWQRRHDGSVRLYRIEHGRLEELASSKPDADAAFGFYFQPKEAGFYVIGTGSSLAPTDKYSFYLKKQDQLQVKITDTSYVLTGKNSAENKSLEQWHNKVLPLERKSVYFMTNTSTYEDFFPVLEQISAEVSKMKFNATGNRTFDQVFPKYRDMNLAMYAAELLSTPRSKHPALKDYPAFYRGLKLADFTTDTRLLRYPFGIRLMRNIQFITERVEGKQSGDFSIESSMRGINNDTLKGEIVLQKAERLKSYLGYTDLDKQYGRFIRTADQAARSKEIMVALAQKANTKGEPAINFTYPDATGKKVSLTDFKGKVVLVDVWATWCGPCKGEIPSLKKLEHELGGKEVVFLSVSVDEEKDHQKWKDFIVNEALGGVQLFASGWSDIAKCYNIKGIPRFMLFDKQGNIVSTDAPRPSDSELKLLLENELKK